MEVHEARLTSDSRLTSENSFPSMVVWIIRDQGAVIGPSM